MTKEEFFDKLSALLCEFEEKNSTDEFDCILGAYLHMEDDDAVYEFNGQSFVQRADLFVRLSSKRK